MLVIKPLSKYTHEERVEYLLGETLEIEAEE